MNDYRDDDQTVGYCPQCGATLSNVTPGGRGYCPEGHRWQWADWRPRYTPASIERWAHDHDEYEYLRMEQKLDASGEA